MKKLEKLDKETTGAKKKLELTLAMSDQAARDATQAATMMSDSHFDDVQPAAEIICIENQDLLQNRIDYSDLNQDAEQSNLVKKIDRLCKVVEAKAKRERQQIETDAQNLVQSGILISKNNARLSEAQLGSDDAALVDKSRFSTGFETCDKVTETDKSEAFFEKTVQILELAELRNFNLTASMLNMRELLYEPMKKQVFNKIRNARSHSRQNIPSLEELDQLHEQKVDKKLREMNGIEQRSISEEPRRQRAKPSQPNLTNRNRDMTDIEQRPIGPSFFTDARHYREPANNHAPQDRLYATR